MDGIPPFPEDDDRWAFMRLLGMCESRFEFEILAAAVLTTHYHFVAGSSREALSQAMQWLNGTYGRGFNKRHSRFGSVFAERFSARVIDSEEGLGNSCAYVYENPVKEASANDPRTGPGPSIATGLTRSLTPVSDTEGVRHCS